MKMFAILLALAISAVSAFAPQSRMEAAQTTLNVGYVPDGMSPEQYRKLRSREQAEHKQKKYAAFGPQSFKSRSLKSFQQDMEKGRVGHLLPMFNSKEKLEKGIIKKEDIPYMQRGGSWDNSDVKTAKKLKWNKADETYDGGQSYVGGRLDWSGHGMNFGGPGQKVQSQQKTKSAPSKRKLFGLF